MRPLPPPWPAPAQPAPQAAHAAYLKWREVPVVERVQPFFRYKALLEKHANDLAAAMHADIERLATGGQHLSHAHAHAA